MRHDSFVCVRPESFSHSEAECQPIDGFNDIQRCVLAYGLRDECVLEYGLCCSVLQCVAVCCSVLQCVAVCCNGLRDETHLCVMTPLCV